MKMACLRLGCLLFAFLLLPYTSPVAAVSDSPKIVTAPHEGHEGEGEHGGGLGDPSLLAAQPALGATPCENGRADVYPCRDVDLLSYVPLSDLSPEADERGRGLWGWTDSRTRREYAVVPLARGTSFVDITDPAQPRVLGYMPGANGGARVGNREVFVYRDHAFVVADGSTADGHGIQIFDLTQLRRVPRPPAVFSPTVHYRDVGKVHTIFIDQATGFAFANGSDQCDGAMYMIDVRQPRRPRFAGCFSTGGRGAYVHDIQCVVYDGPDRRFAGRQICLASNVSNLLIVDVTDKAAPVQISRTTYPGAVFAHQGWLTEDQRYFLLDDEGDETTRNHATRTYLWDLSDLTAPRPFASHTASTQAIDHNQYVRGGFVYQANYRAGLRILDLAQIGEGRLTEVAYFDIVPEDDDARFSGAWNVYPFFASGSIIMSGIEQGLYIMRWRNGPVDEGPLPTACRPGPDHLCLVGGRYWVDASWESPNDGSTRPARSIRGNDSVGYFHFGNLANVELAVKLARGGDEVYVSWAQLTDLPVTIRVIDTRTGTVKRYRNSTGNCGGADKLFAGLRTGAARKGGGGCRPDPSRMCLSRRRFQVELDWTNPYDGTSGRARGVAVSDIAGTFTYRDPRSVEFLAKVLDMGDQVVVFWGALNDFEYTLRVTDTATGTTREWFNPGGNYCGGRDVF